MRVLSFSLKNFRNHENISFSPSFSTNFFTGGNGAGKTAVLEALSLLFRKKSFRHGRDWIQKGFQESSLALEFENKNGKGKVKTFLFKDRPSTYFFNEKKTKTLPLRQCGVFFAAEDLNAIRGSASHRRKLIDDLVLELPLGRQSLLSFQKILAQKNNFLKNCKKGRYGLKDKKKYLKSINQIFFEKASVLMAKRFQALEEIEPFWKKRGGAFLRDQNFKVIYFMNQVCPSLVKKSSLPELLEKEMKKTARLEEIRGHALAGPHCHDLHFFWRDYEARESLSQGQQKALLLSWKLGHWDYSFSRNLEAPCLFFDDVFSEIDQHFSKSLVEFLLNNPAQSFVTTTEAEGLFQDTTVFHLGRKDEINDKQTARASDVL